MDTNKKMPEPMKAEFEAAFRETFGFGLAEVVASNDDAAAAMMGAAAWAWMSSREAVVVDLPKPGQPDGEYDETWHNTRNGTIAACRRAIEAQGLKVAP